MVGDENLEDVSRAKIFEAMKYMVLGDIRTKGEQDQEDDSIRVVSSFSVQIENQPTTIGPKNQSQHQQV
jgi:hypothetical protein